jgi:hypothetical protein
MTYQGVHEGSGDEDIGDGSCDEEDWMVELMLV